MRILHLTPELPYAPGGSGGSTRQFHLLRVLIERGHDVTVVAPIHASQTEGAELLRAAGARLIGRGRPSSRVRETVDSLGRRPDLTWQVLPRPLQAWQASVFWTVLRPLAQREIDAQGADVIAVEHDMAAGWGPQLQTSAPAVLTLHNVSWHYWERRAAVETGIRRLAFQAEARRWRRFDRHQLPAYTRLVAVSDRDRADLRETLPNAVIDVISNGVDTTALEPSPPADASPELVFTGSMNYPPNVEAVRWFASEVWPRLRQAEPRLKFRVVGREPAAAVRALAQDDGIEVTGTVPDVAPYLARATVVVVPMLSGGGTRLKVLDAMASARPVVSTSMGVDGLDVEPGRELVVADGAEAFAAATTRLLADTPTRAALGAAAREAVVERYDWRRLGEEFEQVLTRACSG